MCMFVDYYFTVWWLDRVCTACKQVDFNTAPELNMSSGSFLVGFYWVQPTGPVLYKNGTGVIFRVCIIQAIMPLPQSVQIAYC